MSSGSRKSRIPENIQIKCMALIAEGDSLHQIHRKTGLSKPYISKIRDLMKESSGE